MLLYQFASQEERRAVGGSGWMELQPCRLPAGTPVQPCLDAKLSFWRLDSLYIRDENRFCREYGPIFSDGFYQNRSRGPVDPCGLNYYPPDLIPAMLERLWQLRPPEYETLLEWMDRAGPCHGFYLLGI